MVDGINGCTDPRLDAGESECTLGGGEQDADEKDDDVVGGSEPKCASHQALRSQLGSVVRLGV